MPAYVIFDVEIRNLVRYQDFMSQVKPVREAAEARYFARSPAAWAAFYNGPVYQGLKPIKDECNSARLVSVEGIEG